MVHLRHAMAWIGILLLSAAARADELPRPLRFLPAESQLAAGIDKPADLVRTILAHPLLREFLQLEPVQEAYDSTNARRFYQLLAYVERELNMDRLKLVESLTQGGAALGVTFEKESGTIVAALQGNDETLWRRAFHLALDMAGKEMARQEAKDKIVYGSYRDIETVHIGKNFHAAVMNAALVYSNKEAGLHAALDRCLNKNSTSLVSVASIKQARALAGADASAWFWLNLEGVRKSPQVKEVFKLPRNDPNLTVLFGGWLDVAGQAPFLSAGLYLRPEDVSIRVHMPHDVSSTGTTMRLHIPPPNSASAPPPLEPPGVLFSSSFYFDFPRLWEDRKQLFNAAQNKTFEEFDKKSAPFLAGQSFSKLVGLTGPHQRLVVAHQKQFGYKARPGQYIPAFAWIMEAKEPAAFAKRMDTILRSAGILATLQVKLRVVEEERREHKIVGYRFVDDVPLPVDPNNTLLNFSPCYVAVGKSFVLCSTMDLCRELVDLLDEEEQAPRKSGLPATGLTQFYATGVGALLDFNRDVLMTQAILDSAVAPDAAKRRVSELIEFVRKLGVFQLQADYGPRDFRFDLRFVPARQDQRAASAQ